MYSKIFYQHHKESQCMNKKLIKGNFSTHYIDKINILNM